MFQSATGFGRGVRVALAVSAVLGAAAFGATAAAAHERGGYYVAAPAYYVPAPAYYAPPPPVYYVPQPAPVYGGSVLELMFLFGDNDRGGHVDRGHHDNGRHAGWDRGHGHDRD
jgi:hypothetical protein